MSTDEYVPNGDDERIAHAYAEVVHLGSEGMVSHDEAVGEFYAYLAAHDARVRRDAAREALDGLIADKAHMTVLLHAENGGNVEDVLTHYRDLHYPEESP